MTLRRIPLLHRAEDICSPWIPLHAYFKDSLESRRFSTVPFDRRSSSKTIFSEAFDIENEDPINLLLETSVVLEPLYGRRTSNHSLNEFGRSSLSPQQPNRRSSLSPSFRSSLSHNRRKKKYLNSMRETSSKQEGHDDTKQDSFSKSESSSLSSDDDVEVIRPSDQLNDRPWSLFGKKRSILTLTIIWFLSIVMMRTMFLSWVFQNLLDLGWSICCCVVVAFGLGILSAGLLNPPGVLGANRSLTEPNIAASLNLRQSAPFLWAAAASLSGIFFVIICDLGFRFFLLIALLCVGSILIGLANLNLLLPAVNPGNNRSEHSASDEPVSGFHRFNSATDLAYFSWAKIVTIRGLREIIFLYLLMSQGKPAFVLRPKVISDLITVQSIHPIVSLVLSFPL